MMWLTSIIWAMEILLLAFANQINLADSMHPIGVCYGMIGDNLPTPREVIALYQSSGIQKIRLYHPDASALEALRGTPFEVTLGVRNEDLNNLATSSEAAHAWVSANVAPYNNVRFSYISVGNEAIPGDANIGQAMANIHNALRSVGIHGIRVTTTVALNVLAVSYPPSQGRFADTALETMELIVNFLVTTGNPLMVNVYPYFAYAADPININLDYALCTLRAPPVIDGGLTYLCLVDAMVDAFYSALETIGGSDLVIAISEVGWPSAGNGNFTSPGLAREHNLNLMNHVVSNGTPKRPWTRHETFFFAMFNEDLKPPGVERNWGFYYPNKTPVYPFF